MKDLPEFSPGAYLDNPSARQRHSAKIAPLLEEMLRLGGQCSVDEGFDLYDRFVTLAGRVEPKRRADCWGAAYQLAQSVDVALGFPELVDHAAEQLRRARIVQKSHAVSALLFGPPS